MGINRLHKERRPENLLKSSHLGRRGPLASFRLLWLKREELILQFVPILRFEVVSINKGTTWDSGRPQVKLPSINSVVYNNSKVYISRVYKITFERGKKIIRTPNQFFREPNPRDVTGRHWFSVSLSVDRDVSVRPRRSPSAVLGSGVGATNRSVFIEVTLILQIPRFPTPFWKQTV